MTWCNYLILISSTINNLWMVMIIWYQPFYRYHPLSITCEWSWLLISTVAHYNVLNPILGSTGYNLNLPHTVLTHLVAMLQLSYVFHPWLWTKSMNFPNPMTIIFVCLWTKSMNFPNSMTIIFVCLCFLYLYVNIRFIWWNTLFSFSGFSSVG